MHYEITASHQAIRKNVTTAQRTSSMYDEAPRIGATILRRGTKMKMNGEQFDQHEVLIRRLLAAEAIQLVAVDGEHRTVITSAMMKDKPSGTADKLPPHLDNGPGTPPDELPPSKPKPSTPPAVIIPDPPPAPEPLPAPPVVPEPEPAPAAVLTPNDTVGTQAQGSEPLPVAAPEPTTEVAPPESSKGKKGRK